MIHRYEKKEISSIWTEEAKFAQYLKVELAIMEGLEKSEQGKRIPLGSALKISKIVKINPTRIYEIEEKVKHDVIAFCSSITEQLPPELAKYFHFGVTSSDIIDSALSLQIKDSLLPILGVLRELLHTLFHFSKRHQDLPCMGRSHGMYAEPLSFGQKFLSFYAEFSRRYKELEQFINEDLTCKFSGAVGNYTVITPEAEAQAAKILELNVEEVSTQIIPRDRIAKLIQLNALTASAIERISVEIRHLHRSEVFELHEGFSAGQKGSSIMPHKKNPISAENLTGMSRILRSHTVIALENIVLWHERDISHSGAERLYLPDHFGILYYAITRLNSMIKNLNVHQDVIEKRVSNNFTYLSSFYLHFLLSQNDSRREDFYEILQKAAFQAEAQNSLDTFFSVIKLELKNRSIDIKLPEQTYEQVKEIYLGKTQMVFDRTLKSYPLPRL